MDKSELLLICDNDISILKKLCTRNISLYIDVISNLHTRYSSFQRSSFIIDLHCLTMYRHKSRDKSLLMQSMRSTMKES